jgi:hypothetical protein
MVAQPQTDGPRPFEDARRARERAREALAGIPEVNGFGIAREAGGFVLKVNLDAPTDAVPATIAGVPVRTEVTGPIKV